MEDERFDFVIAGGGHNGSTMAAYLAKSGASVCVVEARPECAGGQENTEASPGFRIDPHATYLYGGAAPGFEQLELAKYGFRFVPYRSIFGFVTSDGAAVNMGGRWDQQIGQESLRAVLGDDAARPGLFDVLQGEVLRDFLRSMFWTPPFPADMDIEPEELPWAQYLKKVFGDFFTPRLLEMSLVEMLDEVIDYEPLKVAQCMAAWYCGAHPTWDGQALPSLAGSMLMGYTSGSPRGGMHAYAHSIIRCALAHGARIVTNSEVAEIVVENGRAVGVRLGERSATPGRVIRADKAVISGADVSQTMLSLVGRHHLDRGFAQRVSDISFKGGSLYVAHVACRELPRYHGNAEFFRDEVYPSCVVWPADSYENLYAQTEDVYSRKVVPELTKDHLSMMVCTHDVYDETRCPDGYRLISPIYIQIPPTHYDVAGPEGANRVKTELTKAVLDLLAEGAPNMTGDNIVDVWVNTPYDSEFRNAGMVAGNWYGARHSEDQWFSQRPLPELSRYRTPIENLYLCNHTSYPGGLCLMAVPYNLMHILIEDDLVSPGSWWYPSPWHVTENHERMVEA
ncbi:MAG: NAD(P)/FAD-dependent oxidoreductase [Acidimicrobiia bacterium]